MSESFDIPVRYKNKELTFAADLIPLGYTYRFEVDVNGSTVFFEPDEERNLRAIVHPSNPSNNRDIDSELLKAIAGYLELIMSP